MTDFEQVFFYDTPVGRLCIGEERGAITRITWAQVPEEYSQEETELILNCKDQLDEYFEGKRKAFELPLAPKGTEFQEKVWDALKEIPYGETRTYGEIAKAVGNPKGARAVGMANNRNPIAIIVPCHRVVGAGGKLVGYAGGMAQKEKLLYLEKTGESIL